MQKFPIITTDRLTLRAISVFDSGDVLDIFSRDEVTEFYDCDSFLDDRLANQWVHWNISLYKKNGLSGFRWAITLTSKPHRLIGSCGIHSVNARFNSFEIGYELHPDHWGQGIAIEAVTAVLNYCFTESFPITVNRVTATTDLNAERSISLLKKLNFVEEGIMREYGFWKGQYHDVRLFSLLRHEFNQQPL